MNSYLKEFLNTIHTDFVLFFTETNKHILLCEAVPDTTNFFLFFPYQKIYFKRPFKLIKMLIGGTSYLIKETF